MAMELIITAPQETEFVKVIEFNFDQLKEELSAGLEKYKGLIYTPETIGDAKKDRATLNKFRASLDDKRKEIKNKVLEPYEPFAAKINQLVGMVDEQAVAIDNQVKAYETEAKDAKKAEIAAYYDGVVGDLKELLPLDRLFNPRWLNASFSMKNVQAEIDETINKTREDLNTLDTLETDFKVEVKEVFLHTLDLGEALKRNEILKGQKATQEARQRAIEQANAARGITPPVVQPVKQPEPAITEPAAIVGDEVKQEPAPAVKRYAFWAEMTPEQAKSLRAYLIETNIRYGSVTNGSN